MIPWNQFDERLEKLGKDRAWLAESTGYSDGHIRTVLAPSSNRRTERIQLALSKAIEDEESRLSQRATLPPGVHELWLTAEQLDRADRAARIVEAPSLTSFCRDAIQFRAREILDANRDPVSQGLPPVVAHGGIAARRAIESRAVAG